MRNELLYDLKLTKNGTHMANLCRNARNMA